MQVKEDWRCLPPTEGQVRIISRYRAALGITDQIEERLSNREEAKRVQFDLYKRVCALGRRRKCLSRTG